jgi:hypothetical protein
VTRCLEMRVLYLVSTALSSNFGSLPAVLRIISVAMMVKIARNVPANPKDMAMVSLESTGWRQ